MRFFASLILSLSSIFLSTQAQQIQFVREELLISIHQKETIFNGVYFFHNPSPDTQKILIKYPFKVSPSLPYPDSIEVYDNENCKGFLYSKGTDGVFFTICLPPFKSNKYDIYYRQQTPEGHFEYILTSTKNWGRALESTAIEIHVPSDIEIIGISYPLESTEKNADLKIYKSIFYDFKPDRDLIIDWAGGIK